MSRWRGATSNSCRRGCEHPSCRCVRSPLRIRRDPYVRARASVTGHGAGRAPEWVAASDARRCDASRACAPSLRAQRGARPREPCSRPRQSRHPHRCGIVPASCARVLRIAPQRLTHEEQRRLAVRHQMRRDAAAGPLGSSRAAVGRHHSMPNASRMPLAAVLAGARRRSTLVELSGGSERPLTTHRRRLSSRLSDLGTGGRRKRSRPRPR